MFTDISKFRVFWCPAFIHMHKKRLQNKFDGRPDRDIYLRSEHGQHRVYLLEFRRFFTIKHVSFKDSQSHFKKGMKENQAVNMQHEHHAN